ADRGACSGAPDRRAQRTPRRLTGPPRLPGATPTPGAPAPTPGATPTPRAPTPAPGATPTPGAPAPTPGTTPTPGFAALAGATDSSPIPSDSTHPPASRIPRLVLDIGRPPLVVRVGRHRAIRDTARTRQYHCGGSRRLNDRARRGGSEPRMSGRWRRLGRGRLRRPDAEHDQDGAAHPVIGHHLRQQLRPGEPAATHRLLERVGER